MNILSIQSHVTYGHVGNAAATFPMQRLGHEVWPIHTVQFSNHTGYGAWRGQVFDAGLIGECLAGMAERGVLATCDGVLSGYMGSADTGIAILEAVSTVKTQQNGALYCCDPVIGDVGRGVFVRPGIAEFMRHKAVPAADLITPNQFELELLCGHETASLPAVRRGLAAVHATGPATILVTSYLGQDTPADAIDLLASTADGLWRVRTPRLDISVNGAGDAIAALFFVHLLDTRSAPEALSRAASAVHGLLRHTLEAGSREIALVAAQDEFVRPSRTFAAEAI
ncbi:pyridoxal kinase PdxY [Lichenihabitans sp. Uapishka_5]|uniref:pyridoxal kinase PdxY n=1 Tax=Lichenihabitans sp. Uapishka_5 TaxID=3037302 RepID=UPI0029E7F88B|nr:pyridoxal kinase PdxY [Lichenihabitans sp. Uapishka_5]MDX7953137.1 pyridoxal kinase PdxY [Lichenihabitans sp. Uapishka_5]